MLRKIRFNSYVQVAVYTEVVADLPDNVTAQDLDRCAGLLDRDLNQRRNVMTKDEVKPAATSNVLNGKEAWANAIETITGDLREYLDPDDVPEHRRDPDGDHYDEEEDDES